jgi:hypothetical protein
MSHEDQPMPVCTPVSSPLTTVRQAACNVRTLPFWLARRYGGIQTPRLRPHAHIASAPARSSLRRRMHIAFFSDKEYCHDD